jgi:ribose transport system permease protein
MPRPAVGRARRSLVGEYGWVWIGTVLLFLLSAILAPRSVAPSALLAMLPFAGMLAIVAVGQTFVIQQRGLDMSVVGQIALSGLIVAYFGLGGMPLWQSIPIALLVGVLVGAVNGFLVTQVNITPIVTTLATNALLIGLVRQISSGAPLPTPSALGDFGSGRILGLPVSVIFAVVFIGVMAIVMRRTVFGRSFVAVGINPAAARAAGIGILRYQIGSYILAALSFAAVGILLSGYVGNASHLAGADYLLPGIAAVVVGGTPLTGGKGSVIASGVAALFITQLGQLVLSLGAPPAVQLLVQALAIIFATGIRAFYGLVRR